MKRILLAVGLLLGFSAHAWAAPMFTISTDKTSVGPGKTYTLTMRLEVPTTDLAALPQGEVVYPLHQFLSVLSGTGPGKTGEITNQAWIEYGDPVQTVYSNIVTVDVMAWSGVPMASIPVPDGAGRLRLLYGQVEPGEFREWTLFLRWK